MWEWKRNNTWKFCEHVKIKSDCSDVDISNTIQLPTTEENEDGTHKTPLLMIVNQKFLAIIWSNISVRTINCAFWTSGRDYT